MRIGLRTRAREAGPILQEPGVRCRSARAATCGPGPPGPTSGDASPSLSNRPASPQRPRLTSSSGVRVSRSPQQQHHRQQQHKDPRHPAIFLFCRRSGPPVPTPAHPLGASRDWPPQGHVSPSSSAAETGSGCRRVGRRAASPDGGGASPRRTAVGGGAPLGAGLPVARGVVSALGPRLP